ncbi:NUDIX domain-containing protein [Cohnella sp. REN36]|uniref:NUDIX domain-containing protein n=1 Tax=Cohnella sp. REN36 TaxID=2887347 RepID=UPI001D147865|nr:NUDIX domain-containing protein [Cohnella sp. REN36]MCC3375396.1 NUDIX domain-containing protein [Cohnella sp. REN36]
MSSVEVDWGGPVRLTWHTDCEPERALVTSVHGMAFHNGELMLVDVRGRGWDIPGGHIEAGETPEMCFLREALEEGCVEGRCEPLGAVSVDHRGNPRWSESGPYPRVGYQAFYVMRIERLHPFDAKHECAGRMFVAPEDAALHYEGWNAVFQDILDAALRRLRPD